MTITTTTNVDPITMWTPREAALHRVAVQRLTWKDALSVEPGKSGIDRASGSEALSRYGSN